MKKLIFTLLLIINFVSAQNDKIYKHNGETVDGTVVRLDEYTITFKYLNEDAENVVGKYAIEKIVYGKSGRTEEITEKITINGEDDWEKVVILEDKAYIAGLKKGDEVRIIEIKEARDGNIRRKLNGNLSRIVFVVVLMVGILFSGKGFGPSISS